MQTYAYGFPRIGRNREYKKIIEGYWYNKSSEEKTRAGIDNLQDEMIATYKKYVQSFPVGEMTFYDNMLDTAIMLGIYKPRNLHEYYELCRGGHHLKMVKWFNTNYHYLVPDLSVLNASELVLHWNKPKEYLERHKEGIPYLIGPFTFLKLSTGISQNEFHEYLMAVGDIYRNVIRGLKEVHIDEPAFVLEPDIEDIKAI
ncbi:MAG: 5-methyltetrahydropteroyltriglutamate--homocysteine S-methyltransferase, partial [Candidatus Kryptoniota bacterium]